MSFILITGIKTTFTFKLGKTVVSALNQALVNELTYESRAFIEMMGAWFIIM